MIVRDTSEHMRFLCKLLFSDVNLIKYISALRLFGTFKVILLTNTEVTSKYFDLSVPPLVIPSKESEFEWIDF